MLRLDRISRQFPGGITALDGVGADHGVRTVMTLHSRVIATKRFAGGERVGYG